MPTIDDVLREADDTAFAIALSNLVFPRWDRDGFDSLTPAEQVIYCVDALEREVNNGGFLQFFDNSSGDTSFQTVSALEAIGAQQAANIVRRAIEAFPGGKPSADREERVAQLNEFGEVIEDVWLEIDQEFYAYPDNLATSLRRYTEANRSQFRDWTG